MEPTTAAHGSIIDIGGGHLKDTLKSMLKKRLIGVDVNTTPVLPTALLSDDVGLEYWKTIVRLPSWYQTRDEIATFEKYGSEIADHITDGMILIDLGCGYDFRSLSSLQARFTFHADELRK